MEPVSAVIIALAAAWAITRGTADAAVSQAAQEARAAADAIRADLRGRSDAWAKTLADRIADGRAGGPATGMWWAWAAARTGRAVRDGLRREPRVGERARQVRGTTGPGRRIFDAGVNGARFAREQAQQQRQSQQRPTQTRLGVCEQCGAVVARQSLEPATVGPAARQLRVCVLCRAAEADRAAQTSGTRDTTSTRGQQMDEPVDAEIVDDQPRNDRARNDRARPEIAAPRPQLDAPRPGGAAPREPAGPPKPPPPALPAQPAPVPAARPRRPAPAPQADPAVNPATTAARQLDQGEPMAPRAPGQLVPRHGNRVATHTARGTGGESYTHGMFNRAVTDVEQRLTELPGAVELMLNSLTAADAGRSQVLGVMALGDEIVQFMQQVREMLTAVNRKEHPVLNAVEAAGGPDEIAGIPYLREV